MHLLYCDETNLQEQSGDFFVYGGIAIDCTTAKDLSLCIDKIRRDFNVSDQVALKFNPPPPGMTHSNFIALKQQIVEAAIASKVDLLTYVILHDVATDANTARRNGINQIGFHFDCLLTQFKSAGLVLIDRFSDKQIDGHLIEKFSTGVIWTQGQKKRPG